MDGGVAGDPLPIVDPSPYPEIVAVESTVVEDPVHHSPPPSDDENLPLQSPATSSDEDLRAKILKQVEYYFSDENLPNDKFLLKQMKKDKEGYVSILLIGSFRKMKKLTKDSSSIINALKDSSQLVMSSDGKKVKRRNPLPSNEDHELCTVVVANLPEDHSVHNIQKICVQAGSIKAISIHDPRAAEDSSKRHKAEKLVNGKMYALVEYDSVEAAEKAVAILNDETDWRNGLRVQPLQKRKGNGQGRKAWRDIDSEKGGHVRPPVSAKDAAGYIHSNEQHVEACGEDAEHRSKEGNGQQGRNRAKGRKYHGNNGMGHGVASTIESSRPPPGPRMPDGSRGFTMGRGRPPLPSHI